MKRPIVIGLILLLFLAACHPEQDDFVETQNLASLQPVVSEELQAVDSLMWQRPDSALALLLPWFDAVDSNETFDNHYAHLLLAELLYKNDYAQTNREALLAAVAYFDSLVRQAPPLKGGRGDSRHALDQKGNPAFLSARAHYINGVGYYEQDSVVEACREYIRALEIMESHFQEKDLTGKKARFMAYTYNRLGDMFSGQFMMESSIACLEQSLAFCRIASTSPFGVSNTLYRLGKQYDKLGQKKKASEYYSQALDAMPILQGPLYRDIVTSKAFYDYQLGSGIEQTLDTLRKVLAQTTDDNERLTRYLTIGDVFFEEGFYDSALFYLEPVFERDENLARQVPVANYLLIIYDSLGQEDKANECMRFLATHKKTEGENKALVSKLEGLFKTYLDQEQKKDAIVERKKVVKKTIGIIVPVAIVLACALFLLERNKGKTLLKIQQEEADKMLEETGRHYEEALEAEQQAHRMEQAALSGRLKESNETLRNVAQQRAMNLYKTEGDKALERILAEFEAVYPQGMEELQASHPDLTETERQIIVLSFLGFRVKEEAELTGLTPNTVAKYRTNIRKKAGSDPISRLIR